MVFFRKPISYWTDPPVNTVKNSGACLFSINIEYLSRLFDPWNSLSESRRSILPYGIKALNHSIPDVHPGDGQEARRIFARIPLLGDR